MKIIFYDLETQFLAQDLKNGWQDAELMRVAVLGYSVANWENGAFSSFRTDIVQEQNINQFFHQLNDCDLAVSWGGNYFEKVLKPFDRDASVPKIKKADLKVLTQQNSSNGVITMASVAESMNMTKLGKSGVEAVQYYRDGHWYELARFVLWDLNILPAYFAKILNAASESQLLVKDHEEKQVGVAIGRIKQEIKKIIDESLEVQPNFID